MLTKADINILKATSKLQMGDHIIFDTESEFFDRITNELMLTTKLKSFRVSASVRKLSSLGFIDSGYQITDDGKTAIDTYALEVCGHIITTYLPIAISIAAIIISIIALT